VTASHLAGGNPEVVANARTTARDVVAVAQLMVVLDATVVNIALPSAQHVLGFSNSIPSPAQRARRAMDPAS
jgi:hypothetical protein